MSGVISSSDVVRVQVMCVFWFYSYNFPAVGNVQFVVNVFRVLSQSE